MLFASGKELKDMLHGAGDQPFHFKESGEGRFNRDKGDAGERADKEDQLKSVWARKSRENAMPRHGGEHTLQESVGRLGVLSKVNIAHIDDGYAAWDGHHRIQAAAEVEEKTGKPVWVPINYVGEKKG